MFTKDNHPIFDELAEQFVEEFGYSLFSVVTPAQDDRYIENVPFNVLPSYDSFDTSFPSEWLLYHPNPEYSNTGTAIEVWRGAHIDLPMMDIVRSIGADHEAMGKQADAMKAVVDQLRNRSVVVLPDPEWSEHDKQEFIEGAGEEESDLETGSISAAMKLIKSNPALDTVMDVIFGPKEEAMPEPGTRKTFFELEEEDQKQYLQAALDDLRGAEFNMRDDEITPRMMVERAEHLYDEAPIQMYHVSEDDEPGYVDISEAIQVGIETGVLEVTYEDADTEPPEPMENGTPDDEPAEFTSPDDPEQQKINTFWNQQT